MLYPQTSQSQEYIDPNLIQPHYQPLSLPLISFSTTFNDPNRLYASFYDRIKSHVAAAGANWARYIQRNGRLEVVINFSNPGPTVLGRSLTSKPVRETGTLSINEQGATSEIRTGIDPNGIAPDIEFNFNPEYLKNELWFDPNPSLRTDPVPSEKTDAISVLTHEFGHAFAFNGFKNDTNGTLNGDVQSTFDEKTSFDGTNFFFNGSEAIAIYGSPVPLTFGNIAHVGNNSPRPGGKLIPDLMNGVQFDRGTRYDISPLDVAILADSGVPVDPTLVVKVETVVTRLQGTPTGELFDLRGFSGQTFKVDTVTESNANYNNYIGFYEVENTDGTLASGLKVTDAGYAEAAIRSAVLRTFKTAPLETRTVSGGKILAPVAISNGTFDEFLNRNPQNKANSNIHAYFNYTGANSDNFDHFKLLAPNKFGLEDLYGGGDQDYNDIIFQATIRS